MAKAKARCHGHAAKAEVAPWAGRYGMHASKAKATLCAHSQGQVMQPQRTRRVAISTLPRLKPCLWPLIHALAKGNARRRGLVVKAKVATWPCSHGQGQAKLQLRPRQLYGHLAKAKA